MTEARVAIRHMSEDDLIDAHAKIENAMRAIGLFGPALDEAIASSFKTVIDLVERDREIAEWRRASLRLVDDNGSDLATPTQ
ncbi:MAG: hypothetical protein M9905_12130 [Rhizobiaceae bacterium]|nr:hypothetical protein [Rhizobiaceae bacterium]